MFESSQNKKKVETVKILDFLFFGLPLGCFYLSLMAVADPWPTVVMAVGRGRRRTVADRGRGRGSWPSPHRGDRVPWLWTAQ